MTSSRWLFAGFLPALLVAHVVSAAPVTFFSTGDPDGKMAMASRPSSPGKIAIETADDFALSQRTSVSGASFTGLLAGGSLLDLGPVRVELYRVFPYDSDTGRTSGSPTFGTSQVPTRVDSPSDVAFDDCGSASSNLSFNVSTLSNSFTANNSIAPGGIHPIPSQTTGGNGPITGIEVVFDVSFTVPFELDAGHYFFVPQVQLTNADGNFYWLSAPMPIVPPGTPFAPDLQAWTRDQTLDPDWLRVGTDIVGQGHFNAAFSLTGEAVRAVPEPGSLLLALTGLCGLALLALSDRRRRPTPS